MSPTRRVVTHPLIPSADPTPVSPGTRWATFVIAAVNSIPQNKAAADLVCTGSNDQTPMSDLIWTISLQNSSRISDGGTVVLLEGTYHIGTDDTNSGLFIGSDVRVTGMGRGTILLGDGITDGDAVVFMSSGSELDHVRIIGPGAVL